MHRTGNEQCILFHSTEEKRKNVICAQSNDHTDVLRPCSGTCDDNAVRKSCIPAKEEAQHVHIGDRHRHAVLVFLLMTRTVVLAAVALAAVALAAVALAAVVHLPAQGGLWKNQ